MCIERQMLKWRLLFENLSLMWDFISCFNEIKRADDTRILWGTTLFCEQSLEYWQQSGLVRGGLNSFGSRVNMSQGLWISTDRMLREKAIKIWENSHSIRLKPLRIGPSRVETGRAQSGPVRRRHVHTFFCNFIKIQIYHKKLQNFQKDPEISKKNQKNLKKKI
jgi:hypothetical protein